MLQMMPLTHKRRSRGWVTPTTATTPRSRGQKSSGGRLWRKQSRMSPRSENPRKSCSTIGPEAISTDSAGVRSTNCKESECISTCIQEMILIKLLILKEYDHLTPLYSTWTRSCASTPTSDSDRRNTAMASFRRLCLTRNHSVPPSVGVPSTLSLVTLLWCRYRCRWPSKKPG